MLKGYIEHIPTANYFQRYKLLITINVLLLLTWQHIMFG